MAVIGRIRKHGVILMIIIGIALLAFIVGDLTQIIPSITNKFLVVQVNNNKARYDRDNTYQGCYEQNRALYQLLSGTTSTDEAFDAEMHQTTWEQFKHETLLDEQLGKLGLSFSKEMIDDLNSDLVESLKSQPTTEAQQMLMAVAYHFMQQGAPREQVLAAFENIEDYRGQGDIYNIYKAIERMALIEAKENTYFAMAANSLYFSKTLLEQMSKDNTKTTAAIAGIDINNPAFDSLKIEVSDSEAKDYFKKHKDHFITHATVKDLDFAVIPVNANEKDAQAAKDSVAAVYNRFAKAENIGDFVQNETRIDRKRVFSFNAANGNIHNLFNYDYKKANFTQVDTNLYLERGQTAYKKYFSNDANAASMRADLDTFIYSHPAGTFIEPAMYENGIYYFGQIRDVAMRPDSIKILGLAVDYKIEGNENSKATRTKEEAKAIADSIAQAIQGQGQEVAAGLFGKYINICGNDTTTWFMDGYIDTASQNLYNTFMNTANGSTYIKEQEGGYIVFQVLEKKNIVEKRQYVLYPMPINISAETEKAAYAKATSIASKSQDVAKMSEIAKEEGAIVVPQQNITSMQATVSLDFYTQLMCRPAVSWAFDESKDVQNKVGQVSTSVFKGYIFYNDPRSGEKVTTGDAYIVAGVKASAKANSPKFEDVKERVIAEVKAEKKAAAVEEQLKQELAASNMAAVAAKYQRRVDTTAINFSGFNSVENMVVGKIAALPADKKANVVSGKNMVYLVAVQSVEQPTETNEDAMMNSAFMTTLKMRLQQGEDLLTITKNMAYRDLESKAKIADRRHIFYKSN